MIRHAIRPGPMATAVLVASCLVAAGCGSASPPGGASAATPEPLEQAFGPSYPPQPAAGRQTRIDRASLSDDKKTLTIVFVGGKGYVPSDPCSADYEPWLAVDGDRIDVTVVEVARQGQATLAPNTGCTLEGYGHTYHLALATPFTGTTVKDRSGGTLFVGTPAGLAEARAVPPGLTLRLSFEQEPGPPAIWVRVYAATDVPDTGPYEGPGRLVAYQAFGLSEEWTGTRGEKARERGAEQFSVSVNGQGETLWHDPSSGELLLGWTLDGKSLALVGNTADMSAAELVEIAQGFVPAP
jgi:hypothetical protein